MAGARAGHLAYAVWHNSSAVTAAPPRANLTADL
jgi:hypothetical protein